MATLILSAIGASIGGAVGGSVIGLSSAVIGRAVGATLGNLIDQRILGNGSEVVPTGRIDRFRLSGASEGDAIPKTFGRVRVGGQVVWASRFHEEVTTTGGSGKGGSRPASSSYRYSVSLALALGEGIVTRIGRVWADGVQIAKGDLNLRVYPGDDAQLPDAKIEAVEGQGNAPAFRGTAYVVLEDLDLGRFGNRVPQFNFEVFRRAQPVGISNDPSKGVRGVALIPGSGEYSLATTPVHFEDGPGVNWSANVNSPSGKSDLETSLDDLVEELPGTKSVSLVVSWFGDDLRCDRTTLTPRVEQKERDPVGMAWTVSGLDRLTAGQVSQSQDRPVYGGTPTDQSVIEAISAIRSRGQEVMFYPFVLMDIQADNGLADPWSGALHQPVMPWRGRITLSAAPGQNGSPDGSFSANAEVDAFFGQAQSGDFVQAGQTVTYSGPAEWSYRRFILHYAHLCALAGGVDAFCIGSELRGITQIRRANGGFPAVEALCALAADVRDILGPDCKIGYAADWSEYFGYQPQDGSGDRLFHLDDLWADPNVDFVGIDNYMPLSDWRDGQDHLDAHFGSIYDLAYLSANIAGGEGYDWYYASNHARDQQVRSPILDGAHGEDWIYRYKDLKGWWGNAHHDRKNGQRQANATAWVPGSKPIWFTELGCPSIDKGCNQPNVFLDPKSSESAKPYYSNGQRDDLMQAQYLSAQFAFWDKAENNPFSDVYSGRMVDMDHAHVWAWDARPWPEFPGNRDLWSDGENYERGHWLNGRIGTPGLAEVVAETCEAAGVTDYDVSRLYGSVTGYFLNDIQSARGALQPLMLAYGFDAIERDGLLVFQPRNGNETGKIDENQLVWTGDDANALQATRAPEAEMVGSVRLGFVRSDGSYEAGAAQAVLPDQTALGVSGSEIPLVMAKNEAEYVVARWLAESRVAQETVSFVLPPTMMGFGAGDVLALPEARGGGFVRVDRVEDVGFRRIDAVRIEPALYEKAELGDEVSDQSSFVAPVPVFPVFLDLPLMAGNEVDHAPHLAVTATPWPGTVATYSAAFDEGYELDHLFERSATIGVTKSVLGAAQPARWDNSDGVIVKVYGGTLSTASPEAVLRGANLVAIGDGSSENWELFQFCSAELTGGKTYRLSRLLRGQFGSETNIPTSWPSGSLVVLINSAVVQMNVPLATRDLVRHYRIGPAQRSYSDSSYSHRIESFRGIGLRPYAPCHLRVVTDSSGASEISWVRRTRIDGDSWAGRNVPLGESFEAYQIEIFKDGLLVRSLVSDTRKWTYSPADKAADGVTDAFSVEVAQISERFGAGSIARISIND